jgi:hypothetical protein
VPNLIDVYVFVSYEALIDPMRLFDACVEVFHSSFDDTAKVDLWDCNGSFTQRWVFFNP